MPLNNRFKGLDKNADYDAVGSGQAAIQARPEKLANYAGYSAALLLATSYFSTSLSTIMSIIIGVLWLLTAQYKGLPNILRQCPVAAWSLALFVFFIIGLAYSSAAQNDGLSMLKKYRELIFIPVLIPLLRQERHRKWAWKAFILMSLLTLMGSFLMEIGILGSEKQHDPSIKSRITHSIFIAFFAFFCLHRILDDTTFRWAFIALFCVSLGDLFFVVQGRTGQLIIIGLILLFTFQRLGNIGRLVTLAIIILSLALFISSSEKANRILEGVDNTQAYLKPAPKQKLSSMGLRYSFWNNSLKLIAEKPLFGHGTGSFSKEYQRIAVGERRMTNNPHNEFLMVAVQLGLVGLLLYCGFFFSQYQGAMALPGADKWLAQGLLLSLVITSLFNTPFLDHTEGHWFAVMIALCFAAAPYTPHDA
jgi:O-antigen ligase